jgi:hypothetical protein
MPDIAVQQQLDGISKRLTPRANSKPAWQAYQHQIWCDAGCRISAGGKTAHQIKGVKAEVAKLSQIRAGAESAAACGAQHSQISVLNMQKDSKQLSSNSGASVG